MARNKARSLTEAEQRVMRVLWKSGEASVRDVKDALSLERSTAYNTVLTVLRVLTEKGYVEPRSEGRAYIYRPLVSNLEARTQALKVLLGQFFEGSPKSLAQHLVDHTGINVEELQALNEEIDAKEKKKQKDKR